MIHFIRYNRHYFIKNNSSRLSSLFLILVVASYSLFLLLNYLVQFLYACTVHPPTLVGNFSVYFINKLNVPFPLTFIVNNWKNYPVIILFLSLLPLTQIVAQIYHPTSQGITKNLTFWPWKIVLVGLSRLLLHFLWWFESK